MEAVVLACGGEITGHGTAIWTFAPGVGYTAGGATEAEMRYAGGLGAATAVALLAGCPPREEPGPGTLQTQYIGTSGYFTTTPYSGYYSYYTTPTSTSLGAAPAITFARLTCSASELQIYVETTGWTGDGLAYLVDGTADAPQPAENHSIASFEFGQDGQWDHLQRELAVGDYVPDESTAFPCDDVKQQRLLLAVEVVDVTGVPADCVLIGEGADVWLTEHPDASEDPAFDIAPCHPLDGY